MKKERSKVASKQKKEKQLPDNRESASDRIANQNDAQTDRDFPGYPHYPPDEDIMSEKSGMKKVELDENFSRAVPLTDTKNNRPEAINPTPQKDYDDLGIVRGTEADLTRDDLKLLGSRDQDMDLGDDEIVKEKMLSRDTLDEELDVPGAELDDEGENIGEEDEENNYYSLGGERHENLEENRGE